MTEAAPPRPDEVTAVERLYQAERARLLRVAVLFVGDRASAEDVVQEAFAALHRRWGTLQDPATAAAYLTVSVANGARSVVRRRRVAFRRLRVGEPAEDIPADARLLLVEEHREVTAAVRRLPRRQQQVVVLRYWSDFSEAQIAQALGISPGTVKSNAARGLENIRKQLEAGR